MSDTELVNDAGGTVKIVTTPTTLHLCDQRDSFTFFQLLAIRL